MNIQSESRRSNYIKAFLLNRLHERLGMHNSGVSCLSLLQGHWVNFTGVNHIKKGY